MAHDDMRPMRPESRANPARNLSREDRARGGSRSASIQVRDSLGQFAGRRENRTTPDQPSTMPGRQEDRRGIT